MYLCSMVYLCKDKYSFLNLKPFPVLISFQISNIYNPSICMLTKIIRLWKSIAFTLVILFLSFVPPAGLRKLPPIHILNFDKVVHMLLYSILTAIIIYDLKNKISGSATRKTLLSAIFLYTVIFGGIVEIMQEKWFYPRSAEWIDWVADILGSLIGILVMYLFKQFSLKS